MSHSPGASPMRVPVFRDAALSSSAPSQGEIRFATAVVLASALLFASMIPYAKAQLEPVSAFIPIYQSVLVVLDLVTFVLLMGQARAVHSPALVTLACGYLFTALMASAHMLTFPGLFAPTGLLGAGPQTTAWLYMFWHAAFPMFVIGYALLKERDREEGAAAGRIVWSVVAVSVAAMLVIALATAGQALLPAIMSGNRYTPVMTVVVTSTWLLSLVAVWTLWRRRPHSVLDLWLMVVMWAWVFDIALSAVLNAGRFDLGFYAGRLYGLAATSVVLLTLLVQDAKLSRHLRERTMELQRAKDEALRAERAKGLFLATMSHEIRTPMNGVMGLLELLSLGRLDDEQRTTVDIVRESSRSLLRIIDDILDFSKIEAGKLTLFPEATAIKDVVERVRNVYSGNASAKGLVLETSVDEAISPYVTIDALRLQQVLNNLVSNAIKFTSVGKVAISAQRLGQRAGADVVRFTVEDTGIGISPGDLARLFQPYVQASERNSGGTGLGLSICNLLAKLMGGTLRMESECGRGTKVTLTLALHAAAAPSAEPPQRPRASRLVSRTMAREAQRSEHVLLVDDHPVNRMVLEKQLQFLGYATVSAANGADALERLAAGGIGAIITDCHMPEMDGYELARRVRAQEAQERRGRLPIIACTANASPNEAAYCFAAGMTDYLAKPVQLEQLRVKMEHWLPLGSEPDPDALRFSQRASRFK